MRSLLSFLMAIGCNCHSLKIYKKFDIIYCTNNNLIEHNSLVIRIKKMLYLISEIRLKRSLTDNLQIIIIFCIL